MRWILEWIKTNGVSVENARAKVLELMDKLDAPESWKAEFDAFITENANLSAEEIGAFVTAAFFEIQKRPGLWQNHAGSV